MIQTTVTSKTVVRADVDTTFIHVAPVDLPSIFTGYGPLPSVTETVGQNGAWDTPGETRTVILSDNSSAMENLTSYNRPKSFGYTVKEFTGLLGHLAEKAEGTWKFEQLEESTTNIEWKYTFYPRSWFSYPVMWFIANVLWRGYMNKALRILKNQLETNAT